MSLVSLCLTSLAGLTTRCHKMAKRIIPTWRDNVLWMYLVGGKKSHAIPTTRSPIVPVLGVLCGGVCVSLRLYDNSAGCLLAMKETYGKWSLKWLASTDVLFRWFLEGLGNIWTYVDTYGQRFKFLHFSQSFATPLGRFALALKTAQSLINAGGAGESICLFAEFEGDVTIFHDARDVTTKWVGYGLTWFYMGSNSESMGVYLVKPTNTFSPFSYVISWKFSTEDDPHWTFFVVFDHKRSAKKPADSMNLTRCLCNMSWFFWAKAWQLALWAALLCIFGMEMEGTNGEAWDFSTTKHHETRKKCDCVGRILFSIFFEVAMGGFNNQTWTWHSDMMVFLGKF